MDNSMKIRIALTLCIILMTSFTPLGAADNPAQAAARAALEKRLYPATDAQPQPSPATNQPSEINAPSSGKSVVAAAATVPEKTMAPKINPPAVSPAPAPTTPVIATPVASRPAVVSPATVVPAAVIPAAVAPAAPATADQPTSPFVMFSFVLMTLLFLSLLIVSFLLLKLRTLKLVLLQHPAVVAHKAMAPREGRPVPAVVTPKPAPAPVVAKVVIPVTVEPVAPAVATKPPRATTAPKRPAQRRKQVSQPDPAAGSPDLPKIEWAATKGERKRPSRAG